MRLLEANTNDKIKLILERESFLLFHLLLFFKGFFKKTKIFKLKMTVPGLNEKIFWNVLKPGYIQNPVADIKTH